LVGSRGKLGMHLLQGLKLAEQAIVLGVADLR
jgi:hypothetical protein